MIRREPRKLLAVQDNYIFYICLILALAIAVVGLITDVTPGR